MSWRRWAAIGLLACIAGAVAFTVICLDLLHAFETCGIAVGNSCWMFWFSNGRPYPQLFWFFAAAGPLVLFGLLMLLLIPACRRWAAIGLLVCTVGAVAFTVPFHYNYVVPIWGAHGGAVRYLNENALLAGFAASAFAYVIAKLGYATAARLLRRVRRTGFL